MSKNHKDDDILNQKTALENDDFFNDPSIAISTNNQQPALNLQAVSRYKNDFDEIERIGQGGQGCVYKVIGKMDKSIYAIKKVKLSRKNKEENERICKEVMFLSKLHNINIVRYFISWRELVTDEKEIKDMQFSDFSEDESGSEDVIKEQSEVKEDTYDFEDADSYYQELSSIKK